MCVVDILAGIMTGGGYGLNPGRPNFGHYVAAYNIEAFMDTDEFKDTMDEWIGLLKSSRPAPGKERVMYPGQPEVEAFEDRSKNGIPLHTEVVEWFRDNGRAMLEVLRPGDANLKEEDSGPAYGDK